MKVTLCPICGDAPVIDKEQLWSRYGSTIHGYYNNYNHVIKCSNKNCPMSQIEFKSDDIYRKPEEAVEKIKKSWNDKCKNIASLLKNNGWEAAIRGMRNPMNSWDKSDSSFLIGENDKDLMNRLAMQGPVHAKYRRMIVVYVDVTAPLYWWKEYDTYKVGTVANSCSTMHKIHAKEFTFDDFSHEHLEGLALGCLQRTIYNLNACRELYLTGKDKRYWWEMIQLLPSSYNQKRTLMLNYEVLANIYHWRKDHKLDEWREFCKWIKSLPHSELITLEEAVVGQ